MVIFILTCCNLLSPESTLSIFALWFAGILKSLFVHLAQATTVCNVGLVLDEQGVVQIPRRLCLFHWDIICPDVVLVVVKLLCIEDDDELGSSSSKSFLTSQTESRIMVPHQSCFVVFNRLYWRKLWFV